MQNRMCYYYIVVYISIFTSIIYAKILEVPQNTTQTLC